MPGRDDQARVGGALERSGRGAQGCREHRRGAGIGRHRARFYGAVLVDGVGEAADSWDEVGMPIDGEAHGPGSGQNLVAASRWQRRR